MISYNSETQSFEGFEIGQLYLLRSEEICFWDKRDKFGDFELFPKRISNKNIYFIPLESKAKTQSHRKIHLNQKHLKILHYNSIGYINVRDLSDYHFHNNNQIILKDITKVTI